MKIYKGIEAIESPLKHPVLTIGNFDGVHIGHQDVIHRVVKQAQKSNGISVVMVFDPHPRTFFNPDNPQRQITTLEQRIDLIEKLDVDAVIVQPFDKAFAELEAETFIREHLARQIGVKELFVSSKFRFGHNAAGNIDMLRALADELGYTVEPVENVHFRHTVVSSSFIRQSILDGEMELARWMLGRPYTIYGEVYPDTQRGTSLLNTPTSNIKPENELIPSLGIYAGTVKIDGTIYPAATYIGTRPTFDGADTVFETHLIGFDGTLYGQRIAVALLKKTRGDMKFDHLSDLLNRIRQDIIDVRAYMEKHKDDPHLKGVTWPKQ